MFNSEVFNGLKLNDSDDGITVYLKPAFYLRDGKMLIMAGCKKYQILLLR